MLRSSDFHLWQQRLQRILNAWEAGRISLDELPRFQRYILEFGQVNANYTLEESKRLNRPVSPFNIMHRHTYLRGTETLATEVLRQLYLEDRPDAKHLYPVFIDSSLFWEELSNYSNIVYAEDLFTAAPRRDFKSAITDDVSQDVWVFLNSIEEKEDSVDCIKRIVTRHLLDVQLPEHLRAIFKKKSHKYNDEERRMLEAFIPDEIAQSEVENKKRRSSSSSVEKDSDKWYGVAYGQFKKYYREFFNGKTINNIQDLRKYAELKPASFDTDHEECMRRIPAPAPEPRHDSVYTDAIISWINQEVAKRLKKFYYCLTPGEKFMGIDVVVLVGHEDARRSDNSGPKAVINRIGYRVDNGRALMAVLMYFPLLFVGKAQTQEFWARLMQSPQISELDQQDQAMIRSLCNKPFELTERKGGDRFKLKCEDFQSRQCENSYAIYKIFIDNYLHQFNKNYQPGMLVYDILMPELYDAFTEFMNAYREGGESNLPRALHAAGRVAEILQLDLAYKPFDSERNILAEIKNNTLKQFPVKNVAMAPYGMRAYLRVLQASKLATHSGNVAKIFVTNQNYFEWLMNLRGIKRSKVEVEHIRQLDDIDETADYIFIEIHPNNVTEKKQFSQNINHLLLRMRKPQWDNKPRTMIIDATLNAMDDPEMVDLLTLATPVVASGSLNIIIMQSLTKFSQLGFDIRSGGLTVVINEGDKWDSFNSTFNELVTKEPIDTATLQYFSYFFSPVPNFYNNHSYAKKYIFSINGRVNLLYQMLLDKLIEAGDNQRKLFRLTDSADARGCYLSLNCAAMLSAVDPDFRLNLHDIEKFNAQIIEDIFIPISIKHYLPISERMSIAFPLSSVNATLDSIRFTVGLESYLELRTYAEIFAHIAASINRLPDHTLLFQRDNAGKFSERSKIFAAIRESFKPSAESKLSIPKEDFNCAIYGPFHTDNDPAYFFFHGSKFACVIGKKVYDNEHIVILQESIATPGVKLTPEQIRYFICGAGYHPTPAKDDFLMRYPTMGNQIKKQFMPANNPHLHIMFTNNGIGIERDYICIIKHGMTIFKRVFSSNATVIEMDYWQEKDPTVSRFITFAIAMFVKNKFGVGFKVRGSASDVSSMYQHFLFDMDFANANLYLAEALDVVFEHKAALLQLLSQHAATPINQDNSPVKFHSDNAPGAGFDTSLFDGVNQFANTALVDGMSYLLGLIKPMVPDQQSQHSPRLFEPSSNVLPNNEQTGRYNNKSSP